MNTTTSALLGAIIGGLIGIVGTIITTWTTFKKESISFKRSNSQKHLEEVIAAYSFALNVFYNIKRDGFPDRATIGDVYARLTLYGSDKVQLLLKKFNNLNPNERKQIDVEEMIVLMKEHIKTLENNLDK